MEATLSALFTEDGPRPTGLVRRMVEPAVEAADERRHAEVTGLHLLIGMCGIADYMSGNLLLRKHGVRPEALRDAAVEAAGPGDSSRSGPPQVEEAAELFRQAREKARSDGEDEIYTWHLFQALRAAPNAASGVLDGFGVREEWFAPRQFAPDPRLVIADVERAEGASAGYTRWTPMAWSVRRRASALALSMDETAPSSMHLMLALLTSPEGTSRFAQAMIGLNLGKDDVLNAEALESVDEEEIARQLSAIPSPGDHEMHIVVAAAEQWADRMGDRWVDTAHVFLACIDPASPLNASRRSNARAMRSAGVTADLFHIQAIQRETYADDRDRTGWFPWRVGEPPPRPPTRETGRGRPPRRWIIAGWMSGSSPGTIDNSALAWHQVSWYIRLQTLQNCANLARLTVTIIVCGTAGSWWPALTWLPVLIARDSWPRWAWGGAELVALILAPSWTLRAVIALDVLCALYGIHQILLLRRSALADPRYGVARLNMDVRRSRSALGAKITPRGSR
ncbi:Clp protease N-terminal domain-containing protein [Actinomadura violacea]|uniref:Clp R domain-containing protein n=1 Tax=Actinomadura violacea TaxID=2819934 RepID=A0ABS3S5M2_9ACTN|nr:Clp protease N-terminal domain-containing protein [Actinomadura violacea]MBO2463510.1 hypothetical protein [Actinomadura violacea]